MSWPATQAGRPASWGALALRFTLGLRVLADALVEGSAPPSRPLSRAAAWGLAPGCRAPPPTRLSPGKHLSPAASVLLWDVPSWPRVGPPAPWSRVFRAAPSGRPARCVALREAAPHPWPGVRAVGPAPRPLPGGPCHEGCGPPAVSRPRVRPAPQRCRCGLPASYLLLLSFLGPPCSQVFWFQAAGGFGLFYPKVFLQRVAIGVCSHCR